ncbi:amino acid adenylation domain-containing protein [Streptomyces sp. NPDC092370]|uniref:non-ribosomal peptide synthetase n=1 Tax=Streptomyces sp. NPDC092370 TaxID=3366016 RepID=UPI00381B7C2E
MTEISQRSVQSQVDRRRQFLERLRAEKPTVAPAGEPLSGQQEHAWVLSRAARDRSAGRFAADLLLAGPVDRLRLRAALERLVNAVPLLRTVFVEEGDAVRQQLSSDPGDVVVELPDGAGPRLAEAADGPPVRFSMWRDPAGEHITVVSSALVLDRASLRPLSDQLAALYQAQDPSTAELRGAGDYTAYAHQRSTWLTGPEGQEALATLTKELTGVEPAELPVDRPYPSHLPVASDQARLRLPAGLLARLDEIAEGLGALPESILLAGYALLLSRHGGQRDVTVGVPVSDRDATWTDLIGNATNLLPVRTVLPHDATVGDVVRGVDISLRSAHGLARVPFPRIVEAVNPDRDRNRGPLTQTTFQVRQAEKARPFGQDATAQWTVLVDRPYAAELSLTVLRDGDGAEVVLDYATDLFDAASAEALLARYERVLRCVTDRPQELAADLEVLPPRERALVLEEWNDSVREEPPAVITDLFDDRAAADPDAVAVTYEDVELTYGELRDRANRLAQHLLTSRLRPEDRVAVFLPRSVDSVVAILAVLKAGGAYVPVDVDFPAGRVETIMQDAAPTAVISTYELTRQLPRGPWLEILLDDDAADIDRAPAEAPRTGPRPDSLAYVIYTSGSSGKPKGVLVEHRAVTNFIHNTQEMFGLSPDDNVLQFATPTFDVSVFEIFGALLSGAALHLCGKEERYSTDNLTRLMRRRHISVVDLPPAVLELLDPGDFPDLRIVFVGGEAFSGELTTRWAADGRRFFNGYGPTETTVTVIAKECTGEWTKSPPIGRAMGNHHAYVLDERLRPLPVGVRGELYVSGLGAARGYLNRPDLTEEVFSQDPFGTGWRMYRTGDLARWTWDGELVYEGRADRQVKIRGIRIELGEIERVLLEHPQVRQGLVRTVIGAGGETRLAAYFVPRPGARPRIAALRAFVAGKLPSYMVPNEFTEISEIPLTASGKVDLAALPAGDDAWQQDDGATAQESAPATETERVVAEEIFAPLLSTERVGAEQNFFQLGGSSLQATQVLSRIRRIFDVEVSVGEFFREPTVRSLAAVVDGLRTAAPATSGDSLEEALAQLEADR